MSACEHRKVGIQLSESRSLVRDLTERGIEHRARLPEQAGIAYVVHVLGRAAEMGELEGRGGGSGGGELLADVVLHRFHVVIDPGLDAFDGIGRLSGRRLGERARPCARLRTESRTGELRYARREMQQPAGLDADALAIEPGLTH